MGSLKPTRDQSANMGRLATKRWEERPMNNDIKQRANGDFEVVAKPRTAQTMVGNERIVDGRRPVMWHVDGEWVHKGWLMPQVTS